MYMAYLYRISGLLSIEHQKQNAVENINNDLIEQITLQLGAAMAKTGGRESTGMPRNENQQHLNDYNS